MAGWQAQLAALQEGGPWFDPWRDIGAQVAAEVQAGAGLHEALNLHAAASVRFAPAQELPRGMAYERYVHETTRCPTRDNLHDFFNGLCWGQLPKAKKKLNELQAMQIARAGVGDARGPVRDAITVFDENGAVLHAPPELWAALAGRQWRRLFVDLRPLWRQARLIVFGHALLEKLVQPRKDIAAHVWRGDCPAGSMVEVDAWLAGEFTAERLAAKPFAPLPVLGIPGWAAENENLSFYDDSLVFRPPGRRTPST
ncbi:MAG: DUF3025 domain-containing protein [Ramlibacter sp.]|nr:DUF3025 domain-containing protein [Ramlibacter sp.]